MRLKELFRGIKASMDENGDREIGGIAYHSGKVKKGDLFCCLRGQRENGHSFASEALKRGAVALLVDRKLVLPSPAAQIVVEDSREVLALVSDRFYGHPSTKLKVIGITGTNGKTTTSYLLKSIYERAGYKVGVLGTIGHLIGGKVLVAEHTTPESLDLQRLLSEMLEEGVEVAAMEVSSHALAQSRVVGVDFDVGVFTNLSRDHLDFHSTLKEYGEAKLKLFSLLGEDRLAVVNLDDPFGERVIEATRARGVSYGLASQRDFSGRIESLSLEGSLVSVTWREGTSSLRTRLLGRGNVYNILSSFAVACSDGVSPKVVKEGVEALQSVPGRFQLVDRGQPFKLIIDYAHTPEALRGLLLSLKELTPGRVISLFGCGGDRDRGKRPLMGRISTKLAHHTILTSDNPRSEEPVAIIRQIEEGIEGGSYEVIPDREEAIGRALKTAKEGDSVALCGKGHEDYQIVGEERIPFDDFKVASQILEEIGWRG